MSLSMHWKPAHPAAETWPSLPYALKSAIARRLWDHDGSTPGDEVELGLADVSYLEGLHDAGVVGAHLLIDAIAQHRAVVVWIGDGTRP